MTPAQTAPAMCRLDAKMVRRHAIAAAASRWGMIEPGPQTSPRLPVQENRQIRRRISGFMPRSDVVRPAGGEGGGVGGPGEAWAEPWAQVCNLGETVGPGCDTCGEPWARRAPWGEPWARVFNLGRPVGSRAAFPPVKCRCLVVNADWAGWWWAVGGSQGRDRPTARRPPGSRRGAFISFTRPQHQHGIRVHEGWARANRAGVAGERRQDAESEPASSERRAGCPQRVSGEMARAFPEPQVR